MHRLRIGQHDDHLFRALCKRAFDGLRHMDFVRPLFGSDGIAVQGVHDRVAARLVMRVARRQEHEDVAIDRVAFQIAFQRCSVDFYVLHGHGLCTRDWRRHVSLHLGSEPRQRSKNHRKRYDTTQFRHHHFDPLSPSPARDIAVLLCVSRSLD